MKTNANLIGLILAAFLMTGCETTGMSLRETGPFNYSNFVYGLYGKNDTTNSEKVCLQKPFKLAVAQVGENAPPEILLDNLRKEHNLFSQVMPIPVGGPDARIYYRQENVDEINDFQVRMHKMRMLAKDLGADYIFLFGGSADYGSTYNWSEIFDLTIIGAYIIPSNKITADGRAAGTLINVATGRVIFMVDAQDKKEKNVPTALAYSQQEQVLSDLRDDLAISLSNQFIDKIYAY